MKPRGKDKPFCDIPKTVFCGIISGYIIVGVFTKYDQLAELPEKYWDNDCCKTCFFTGTFEHKYWQEVLIKKNKNWGNVLFLRALRYQ